MILKEKFERVFEALVVRSCDRYLLSSGKYCNIEMLDSTRKITIAFFAVGREGDILLVGDRFLGCNTDAFHEALKCM
jgi:hypothetical protein